MNNSDYQFVFCVGMRRGGSTLQTQLVGALFDSPQVHLVTPETVSQFIRVHRDDKSVVIAKAHRFLPEVLPLIKNGEARVVYVYRDLRDVVASISKKYNIPAFSFVHGGLRQLLDEYEAWTSISEIHVSSYESMTSDIANEAMRLAAFLNRSLSLEQAATLATEFSIENQLATIKAANADAGEGDNRFNAKSLLHSNHIQSGGSGAFQDVLPPSVVAALEWQLRSWMLATGYKPVNSPSRQYVSQLFFESKAMLHFMRRKVSHVMGLQRQD